MARKHVTQFTPDERCFAVGFVRNQVQPHIKGSPHFYDQAADRHFTLDDASKTLHTGLVIEVHNDKGEWRAVVRSKNGTCVVVSLESNRVLTVYSNDPTDNHDTLNHGLYHGGKDIDVVAIVKNLLAQRKRVA
jgi:hypothetical protein